MTKREYLRYLENKLEEGYIVNKFILLLFEDDEKIPEDVMLLCCYKPQRPIEPIWVVGAEFYTKWQQELDKYFQELVNANIIEEHNNEFHKN
jgi:hypothetical protein